MPGVIFVTTAIAAILLVRHEPANQGTKLIIPGYYYQESQVILGSFFNVRGGLTIHF